MSISQSDLDELKVYANTRALTRTHTRTRTHSLTHSQLDYDVPELELDYVAMGALTQDQAMLSYSPLNSPHPHLHPHLHTAIPIVVSRYMISSMLTSQVGHTYT